MLRMRHIAMDGLVDQRSRVADWFGRVEARPTYAKSVTDWLPQPILDLFHSNGETVRAEVDKAAASR
ncbi:MAG: hypothetical protein CL931_02350 [Deltaproteobacteria bacterium]|nr:hypothetical protein [Deltaproteobacteria bacterium]